MKKYNFTLIELLIIVAIIAVQAVILLPVLDNARDNAKASQCANNLRQLGVAIEAYCADNNSKIVVKKDSGEAKGLWKYSVSWSGLIVANKYTRSLPSFLCPATNASPNDIILKQPQTTRQQGFNRTSVASGLRPMWANQSYGMNCSFYGSANAWLKAKNQGTPFACPSKTQSMTVLSLDKITDAAAFPLLSDSGSSEFNNRYVYGISRVPETEKHSRINLRHEDTNPVSFADGSVQMFSQQDWKNIGADAVYIGKNLIRF